MTLRERLLDIVVDIGTGPDDGALVDINAEDAAALRELDQLMEEVVKFLSDDTPWDEVALLADKWLDRAAQAGYGGE